MISFLLPFITAIGLSSVAAFYSVVGLAQIFPGSFWPIVIMGSILEASKLVTVSWLYNNWNETNRIIKYYFMIAVFLLMAITSMGIFGFLSRAHIESNVVVGANTVQLKTIETQEKIVQERLNYLLQRAGDPATASRKLDRQIQETQAELRKLSNEKLPLLTEENKLTAEIGPIKYIADMLYDKEDPGFIDKAVRLVIFVIIFVFDPLAILLLIAANQTYRKLHTRNNQVPKVKKKTVLDKKTNLDIKSLSIKENTELIPKHKIANIQNGDML